MQPIDPNHRRIANIHRAAFTPFVYPDGVALGDAVLQLDSGQPLGVGFHVYRMPPGMTTRSDLRLAYSNAAMRAAAACSAGRRRWA